MVRVDVFTKKDFESLKKAIELYEENYDEFHKMFNRSKINAPLVDGLLMSLDYALLDIEHVLEYMHTPKEELKKQSDFIDMLGIDVE